MVLSRCRVVAAMVITGLLGGCSPSEVATSPMLVLNRHDQPLVVRIVARQGVTADASVPAGSRRRLVPETLDVDYVVVFDDACETLAIILFGDGDPSFASGGLITVDPVGLGVFEPGPGQPHDIAASRTSACSTVLTPSKPT